MTLLLAAVQASPVAAGEELGISLDRAHWSSSISTPLFDESMRWVPGDSEHATFFIRNDGGSAGDLTVDVLGSSVGNLIESGRLHVTAKGGGGDWTSASAPGRLRLLTRPQVPDGDVLPVDVNVRFDTAAVNSTQLRATALIFHVTLTESSAGSDTGSGLPHAGAPELLRYFAISAILIGTGLALVARRARSPREVRHV